MVVRKARCSYERQDTMSYESYSNSCLQWDALDDAEKDRFGYERELKRFMDGMLEDLRRKIARNEQRLKQNEIPVLVSSEQVRRRVPPL